MSSSLIMTYIQDDPEHQEEREKGAEPEEHRFHHETQSGHGDPITHPVQHEAALAVFSRESDEERE